MASLANVCRIGIETSLVGNWEPGNRAIFRRYLEYIATEGHSQLVVELSVVVLLKPPSHVSIPGNQNGTLAEDALLMEKFISAESVR